MGPVTVEMGPLERTYREKAVQGGAQYWGNLGPIIKICIKGKVAVENTLTGQSLITYSYPSQFTKANSPLSSHLMQTHYLSNSISRSHLTHSHLEIGSSVYSKDEWCLFLYQINNSDFKL